MASPAGILVVAAQRELRRALFDTFDQDGHFVVHSARDATHAGILLEGRSPLALIVMVFEGDGREAMAGIEVLRSLPACVGAPVLAVLDDGAVLKPNVLPAGIADWLYASQIEHELLSRWQRMQRVAAHGDVADDAAASRNGDYRFAFDEVDAEWLIVDPARGRLVDYSPALARNSGLGDHELRGRPIKELLAFAETTVEHVIAEGSRQWHAGRRRSSRGADSGEVSARAVRHAGRDAVALMFRSDRACVRAEVALALLARMFASGSGDEGIAEAARLLYEEMGLDYLAVWSARPDEGGAPVQLVQYWRGDEQLWPGPHLQSSLRLVLSGQAMLHQVDAARLAPMDPLLAQLGLAGFAGWPLQDERRTVLGALLIGTRQPLPSLAIVQPVLRVAASRFAHAIELRHTREQGRAEGLLDALTGLPNRLLFNDRLDTVIREANRTGECFALLFVDLDRFKTINDTLGHAVGDQVLLTTTQRLRSTVRASDTVARYAGDEFVVILRHIVKNEDVLRIAEKIVQVMGAPLRIDDGTELQVTASIGVSFFPDDAPDADTLLKHADEAMYAAKSLGRNNYQIFEGSAEQSQQQNLALKSGLRHAEHKGELRVFYQPQVDAVTEDIVGMEALVRWEHPELGFIGPGFFIPLAEETGLIVSIGEWVLRAACRHAQEWERRFGLGLRLGVNLSAVQLMQPNLLEVVSAALDESGLEANLLEMEITESISIKAAPNLVENLQGLHRLGVRIAIDDFGTGAASLDYLRKLPADRIKIDQSFVRNIGVDPDDEAIVRATIEMAHRLKRGVVAEGVETEQHMEFLRANHCDELQGYLFCRPLPQPAFEKLLLERQRLLAGVGDSAA
ncbi:diguanylate cyclase (GGDEF) domain-containing protein [Dyella jiangningensis]|uniref:putative bifunctional diguanylate cyclase/phosphodiesterase n=1 Tax=Dyella sp. AtDHG13 TaxID=1938897 RepID=UPI000886487D|nr:bifunctional diguanylate cyclase/phosphodiesterase [Dyella sp. AtDHG13]PXV61390.1 diguanylate cyclase (GGDEF)-like protein [Dyella sp. AtDHG13]SDJ91838.1 diguanylate cyclase (GGDEF) domain-containing protein [Dyella jiangningensis]